LRNVASGSASLADPAVVSDLIKHLDPNGDATAQPPTDNIDFDKFSWEMARLEMHQVRSLPLSLLALPVQKYEY